MLRWVKQRAESRIDGRMAVRMTVWLDAEVYEQFVMAVVEGRKRSLVITEALRKLVGDQRWLDGILDALVPRVNPPAKRKTPTKKRAPARIPGRKKRWRENRRGPMPLLYNHLRALDGQNEQRNRLPRRIPFAMSEPRPKVAADHLPA